MRKLLAKYVPGNIDEVWTIKELMEPVLKFDSVKPKPGISSMLVHFPLCLGDNAQATVRKWNQRERRLRG